MAKLEQRLRDAGVYNSVTVSLATEEESVDGLRPVVVSLGDRPPHTIELGGGYSTSEGRGRRRQVDHLQPALPGPTR